MKPRRTRVRLLLPILIALAPAACIDDPARPSSGSEAEAQLSVAAGSAAVDLRLVAEGRRIFRFDDFGDWRLWTDELRLNELVEGVSPASALSLGLKVDSDAVPAEVLAAVQSDPALLDDPAVTRALLSLDAVVGLRATVEGDRISRIGITCALCHSTVDDAVAPGIGERLDGWPNLDLEVGTIISLTPGLPDELRATYAAWLTGFFDPRFNVDGISDPVVIPPAYGLARAGLETYTAEGPISYWNNYVAVVEMGGHGSFRDPRLGIDIRVPPAEDEVRDKLAPLRKYQRTLEAPAPPQGSFDPEAAEEGRVVFETVGRCADCHTGPALGGGGRVHAPAATGMDPTYAERGTTGGYRATPLRGLWQHAPYFHDGSATTLSDVVEHYDAYLDLGLSVDEKRVLLAYLASL